MTYYPNRTSFSCSGIRSSFNTSTPDSFSTKDNSSPINTPHQLTLDQSFQNNPLFTYSFDTDSTVSTSDWHMFPVQNHTAGLLRKGEGHHRNVSESTVNSTALPRRSCSPAPILISPTPTSLLPRRILATTIRLTTSATLHPSCLTPLQLI
jgi:hypothetical protein